MRVIGNIEHPQLKITIFKMDNRFTVKFENEWYEQAYRFYQDGKIETIEQIKQIIDETFIADVQEIFTQMHKKRMTHLHKILFSEEKNEFDIII